MEKIRALLDDYLTEIDNIISCSICRENILMSELGDFVEGNSKRIRSILCLLYLKSNNININNDILLLCSVAELIHNASLLHDDVIDGSDFRRGIPSILNKYDSKVSILLGDYLLTVAVKLLMSIDNIKFLQEFLNCVQKMCSSEINQYLKHNVRIDLTEYVKIAEGKTASLFSALLKCSALYNNSDVAKAEYLGNRFGVLFQLNNDLLPDSIVNDKKNGVMSANFILGVEKTQAFKDNYKEEIKDFIEELPKSDYSKGLKDLIDLL